MRAPHSDNEPRDGRYYEEERRRRDDERRIRETDTELRRIWDSIVEATRNVIEQVRGETDDQE